MKITRNDLFALLAICLALVACALPAVAQSRTGFTYNGINHVSWWYNEYNNFDQPTGAGTNSRNALAATGANWTALLVTWYQDNATATAIAPNSTKTPTDASLTFAINELHAKGIKVMLKPHIDGTDGSWRGTFQPSNVDAWFQSYTQFILHYAQLAQSLNVEGLIMGTEFVTLSGAANQARWNAVISAVRASYGGVLTYAANATYPADEFTSVSFWDRLDVIGLDGYFVLTNHADPTPAELVAAWTSNANGENIVAAIQNLAAAHNKPVMFTEVGYKSVPGANTQPWNFGLSGPYDPTEQRNCYDAFFTVWSQNTSFMKGVLWWDWMVPLPAANDTDYTPWTKPASDVLRTWFGGSSNGPDFALSASPPALSLNRGASASATVSVVPTGSFTGSVSFSVTGLPSGVTATFNPVSSASSSMLLLIASATASPGSVTLMVTGTSGTLSHTIPIGLTVNGPTPDFSLSANPASLTVNRGSSGAATVSVVPAGGFTGSVTFSAGGLPAGVTAAFTPGSSATSTTITLTASSSATTGTSTVTVTGVSGALRHTVAIGLTINAPPASDFSLSASPASLTISRGASGSAAIAITRTGGFASSVALTASGQPSGVTAAFSPASTTGASSTLTLTASSAATTGAFTVTVTGAGGGLTRTTSLTLIVSTGNPGGVTITPVINSNSPWYHEQAVRIASTAPVTALSITITIQNTGGITYSGQYNTVGGQIAQSHSGTATITYQFTQSAGQTLNPGTYLFAAQAGGTGAAHPTSGDAWSVTYTTGGASSTQTGHF